MNQLSVLTVDGYDASLYVERGHLVVRGGFPSEGEVREIRFPRGRCEIERIVVRAKGGNDVHGGYRLVCPHGDRSFVRGVG